MKRLIKIAMIACVVLIALTAETCTGDSDTVQRVAQEKILAEGSAQTGMPAIVNFRERKLLKEILELRDQENISTYTYIVAEMTGQLVLLGKSIGYGIPYSTQYTNPMKPGYVSSNSYTIPQADPNGLFNPASSSGTWVMLVDPTTSKPRVVYIEPMVIVSPFPLTKDTPK